MTAAERTKFWHVCPDIVIENLSDCGGWRVLLGKLDMYMHNGARFAVAIDSFNRQVKVSGKAPFGLSLDYDAIMNA